MRDKKKIRMLKELLYGTDRELRHMAFNELFKTQIVLQDTKDTVKFENPANTLTNPQE